MQIQEDHLPSPPPADAVAEPEDRGWASLEAFLTSEERAEPPPPAAPTCLLGTCLDTQHPTLQGRVLVCWTEAQVMHERWVPVLQGLAVRSADRVLLMQPANHDEAIVTGVLDGFTRRPEPTRETAATLEIQRDEAVRVASVDGQELIEVFQGDEGPVVRLLHDDVHLELPGALRMKAARIALEATQGSVEVDASDDVNVRGEVINLN
ncbi:MAG TPA: hypothetical protein VKP65_21760 [Rhodothermales bacterium]|nr:hypothetical protein [Rhodothermales bacterium]